VQTFNRTLMCSWTETTTVLVMRTKSSQCNTTNMHHNQSLTLANESSSFSQRAVQTTNQYTARLTNWWDRNKLDGLWQQTVDTSINKDACDLDDWTHDLQHSQSAYLIIFVLTVTLTFDLLTSKSNQCVFFLPNYTSVVYVTLTNF